MFWKIAKIVLAVILFLLIAMTAIWVISKLLVNHRYREKTEILESANGQPEKALVVYQPSVTKATGDIARSIAQGMNDAGYEVTVSYPGAHLSEDISGYSVVVFGSPVYMGQSATALTDYMKSIHGLSQKRIILFLTGSDTDGGPALDQIKELLNATEPYSSVKFMCNKEKEEENKAMAYQLGADAAREE